MERFQADNTFNWQSTLKRSALRITRETELLGSEVSSSHSRENIVLRAKFLSGDLPYFAELLAEVASQTKYPSESFALVLWIRMYGKKPLTALTSARAKRGRLERHQVQAAGPPVEPGGLGS
mgnify:CR=1 FL=1